MRCAARESNGPDHLGLCALQAEKSEKKGELRRHRVVDVGNAYLNELVQRGEFVKAARQCQVSTTR